VIKTVSRGLMTLAVRGLGAHRREWAAAMQVEFEVASRDGSALPFAFGCFLAACRQLPDHEEGRFTIACHLLVLIVIVPASALLTSTILAGFPEAYLGSGGVAGLLQTSEESDFLNEGNRFAVPALALLVLVIAALKLRIAWLALDRDWTRLAGVAALSLAGTVTLVLVSTLVFFDVVAALAQVGLLTIELTGVLGLARWHSRLPSTTP
jgi:hypothetical protein